MFEKRSLHLLCVLDLFSERWQSTVSDSFLLEAAAISIQSRLWLNTKKQFYLLSFCQLLFLWRYKFKKSWACLYLFIFKYYAHKIMNSSKHLAVNLLLPIFVSVCLYVHNLSLFKFMYITIFLPSSYRISQCWWVAKWKTEENVVPNWKNTKKTHNSFNGICVRQVLFHTMNNRADW